MRQKSKKMPGFIRKGRALVFAATSGQKLNGAVVQSILEEARDARHKQIFPGLKISRQKL
jgi:hypothetical protein